MPVYFGGSKAEKVKFNDNDVGALVYGDTVVWVNSGQSVDGSFPIAVFAALTGPRCGYGIVASHTVADAAQKTASDGGIGGLIPRIDLHHPSTVSEAENAVTRAVASGSKLIIAADREWNDVICQKAADYPDVTVAVYGASDVDFPNVFRFTPSAVSLGNAATPFIEGFGVALVRDFDDPVSAETADTLYQNGVNIVSENHIGDNPDIILWTAKESGADIILVLLADSEDNGISDIIRLAPDLSFDGEIYFMPVYSEQYCFVSDFDSRFFGEYEEKYGVGEIEQANCFLMRDGQPADNAYVLAVTAPYGRTFGADSVIYMLADICDTDNVNAPLSEVMQDAPCGQSYFSGGVLELPEGAMCCVSAVLPTE